MAYDEDLADRIREEIGARPDVAEMRMFGGLAFLVNGNMAVVAQGRGGLMVRVDPDTHEVMLAEPGADAMVMRGRPMRGWITVAPQAYAAAPDLARWVRRGLDYAGSLPPK